MQLRGAALIEDKGQDTRPSVSRSTVDGSTVSSAPHPFPARPATALPGSDTRQAPQLRASSTVIGYEGSELISICRHTERDTTRAGTPALLVLEVSGDIDLDTAPTLQAALTSAIERHRYVCCDLAGVGFFGAAGANTILSAWRHADETGCAFTVRGIHGTTKWVLQIAGLDGVVVSGT
jgi:anti-anti-sigma factor